MQAIKLYMHAWAKTTLFAVLSRVGIAFCHNSGDRLPFHGAFAPQQLTRTMACFKTWIWIHGWDLSYAIPRTHLQQHWDDLLRVFRQNMGWQEGPKTLPYRGLFLGGFLPNRNCGLSTCRENPWWRRTPWSTWHLGFRKGWLECEKGVVLVLLDY